jgi:DNA-binding response OmpR family regulator
MQTILKEFLAQNHLVTVSGTCFEAFALLQKNQLPDLIISDLSLPSASGIDFINQLKASNFFQSIPVIILSGADDSETRIQCFQAGAVDVLSKPFNPIELQARINVVLKWMGKLKPSNTKTWTQQKVPAYVTQ